jgi:hypothetical protein
MSKDFEELFACLRHRNVKALFAADDFSTPGKIVQLGVAPNRVDLLTVIDGVTFDEAWSGRVAGHYGAQAVEYIGRADLIRNKRASGRPQDLLDIDSLT